MHALHIANHRVRISEAAAAVSALAQVPPPLSAVLPVALEQSLAKTLAEAGLAQMASAGLTVETAGSGSGLDAEEFGALTEVAAFLAASGYKPRADWQVAFEAAVIAAARQLGGGSSGFATSAARALAALSTWSRRLPAAAMAPVLDASRRSLPAAPASALGPLLFGLLEVGAKPDGAWMCDWEGVTRDVLEATVASRSSQQSASDGRPADEQQVGSAADVAAIAAAAARAGISAPGKTWTDRLAAVSASLLKEFSDADLSSLASGLHGLRHRPDASWTAAVQAEVERRRGVAAGSADVEAAAAWFAALRG